MKRTILLLILSFFVSINAFAYTPKSSQISADTTNFDGNLSESDDTVQKALDTLDDNSGSGAPTTADYLVGTSNGSLSAEIVVGTSPGGELGGTWASPTIDDSIAVTSWNLTTPTLSGKVDGDGSSVNDDDCTGEQGFIWYDDTDSKWEVCNDNSGTPVALDGTASTATALASNGSNCSAGSYPLGVDASGASETCTDATTEIDSAISTHNSSADHSTITAGRSLTRSTDDILADAELYTTSIPLVLESPTTDDDALIQAEAPVAFTITEVSCSTDTGTVTIQLDERTNTTPNSSGTDIMTAQLVCDSNRESTTSFDNAGIASGAVINLDIDAVASSPGVVRINVKGTKDD